MSKKPSSDKRRNNEVTYPESIQETRDIVKPTSSSSWCNDFFSLCFKQYPNEKKQKFPLYLLAL